MADIKAISDKRGTLVYFDPRRLKVMEGLNVRDMSSPEVKTHIEWLAESISEQGVKTPLEIFSVGDEVYVASGHCRLAATMLAIERGVEVAFVPCTIEGKVNDGGRVLNQILDNSGLRLTPLEEGIIIRRAANHGWTPENIARKIGKSISHVRGALDLEAAPAELHTMIQAGEVAATEVVKAVRTSETPKAAVEKIKAGVDRARAAGKTKATAKFIELKEPAAPKKEQRDDGEMNADAVKINVRGPSLIGVKITGAEIVRDRAFWDKLCNRILDIVEKK